MAMPQRPVGLDINLSQPNVRPVSPQNSIIFLFRFIAISEQFTLTRISCFKTWRIRWAIRRTIFIFSQLGLASSKFSMFWYVCHFHYRPSEWSSIRCPFDQNAMSGTAVAMLIIFRVPGHKSHSISVLKHCIPLVYRWPSTVSVYTKSMFYPIMSSLIA